MYEGVFCERAVGFLSKSMGLAFAKPQLFSFNLGTQATPLSPSVPECQEQPCGFLRVLLCQFCRIFLPLLICAVFSRTPHKIAFVISLWMCFLLLLLVSCTVAGIALTGTCTLSVFLAEPSACQAHSALFFIHCLTLLFVVLLLIWMPACAAAAAT